MKRTGLAAGFLLVLSLVAGCGGEHAGEEIVKGLRDPDAETRAKMVQFAQCMRDAGHDFPDPGPNGFDFRKFTDADDDFKNSAKECHEKHPFVDLGDVQRPLNELRPVARASGPRGRKATSPRTVSIARSI